MAERYGALPPDIAQLSNDEIERLMHGAELREEEKQRAAKRGGTPSPDQQRREEEALESFA